MEWEMYLAFAAMMVFFALALWLLKRFAARLAKFAVDFWITFGVVGAKDGSMGNDRVNGIVLVASAFVVLVGGMAVIVLGGTRFAAFKLLALMFVVALIAPLVAKWLGGRKRNKK